MSANHTTDFHALYSEASAQRGRAYWRSLEELAGGEEFQQYLQRAYPEATFSVNEPQRREFLTLLGASLALAGLTGCSEQKAEKIVPYIRQPELILPGKPLYFATAMTTGGIASGLLVESHMGRPTKIEGNPRHPSVPAAYSNGDEQTAPGVSDIFSQAAMLSLYDPDRSQTVAHAGAISTWDAFLTAIRPKLESEKSNKGRGIRLLTETVTSPTLAAQIEEFRQQFPEAKWHQFEPVNDDNALAGAKLALGEFATAHYHLDRADVVVSLDSDLLISGADHLRHAFEFANRCADAASMPRLYALESTPTLTGAKADHRLPARVEEFEAFATALAVRLGIEGDSLSANALPETVLPETVLPKTTARWLDAMVSDLKNYRPSGDGGASLIVAGAFASPRVHALVHAMNDALGNIGKTVTYTTPAAAEPVLQQESLRELVADMTVGTVDMLCILDGNPVYNAPADLQFAAALDKVPLRIRLGLYEDETSARCHWHIPAAHFLESWGDARAADGTASIIQPLIAPLYQGRTPHDLLASLLEQTGQTTYALVQSHWQQQLKKHAADFDVVWQTALHEGFIAGTEFPEKQVTVKLDYRSLPAATVSTDDAKQVVVVFRPDPTVGDGCFANNGWLQELPKPFSKLTWDNAVLVSPALAEQFQVSNGDVVEMEHDGNTLQGPVWITPGHPEGSVTLHLGYGRTRAGHVGTEIGFNAYALQSSGSPWHLRGATLKPTGRRASLVATQHHHLMDGRDLVRVGTLDKLLENPEHPEFMRSHHHIPEENGEPTSFFPNEHPYDGYKWGMTIDLNRCTGCNACMVACQAENNIPVVGKQQVAAGREMHWIRVDSYYEGEAGNPRVVHQPVPCMHCENAPCELVCPVGATVHSDEGLNEMVYNRCVGTRYCSNNCPYKVRRFNFLQYSDLETPSLKLLNNPDVTVRNRGVMEKCTYCVQRISAARIQSEKEDRTIHDGEVVTACQAACPSQAIVFGDLNDADSRVTKQTGAPLNYALLEELNTHPRTTYLAAMRNPNPTLESTPNKTAH